MPTRIVAWGLGSLLLGCSADANRGIAQGVVDAALDPNSRTHCQSGSKYGTQCRTESELTYDDEPGDPRRRRPQ